MIYRFVKKSGNVTRIPAIDAQELELVLNTYLGAGYELALAEEHDRQVIGGAQAAYIVPAEELMGEVKLEVQME